VVTVASRGALLQLFHSTSGTGRQPAVPARRQGSIGEHQVARLRGPGRPADSQRAPRVRLGVALERARTRFNYYGPLLRLGPLQDAGELLQACSAGWFAPALGAAKLDTARVTAVVFWCDPYRMSMSLSTAAASRNARRSAPSGVRYRFRRPAS